jgi:hypothetical protein
MTFGEPVPPETIAAKEKELGVSLPPDLVKFLLTRGSLKIGQMGAWVTINLFKVDSICGIIDCIDKAWGCRPEFEENFTPEQIKYLNKNYFGFGMQYVDDNQHKYYFFDRAEKYDTLYFDQDYGDYITVLEDMLSPSPAPLSIDALISGEVDCAIEKLMEDYLS